MFFEAKSLVVNYGNVKAIKNISFDVEDRTIVTLIGSNGAGKSTLLKTISGLLKPVSGEILFKEKRITSLKPHAIVQMGISHVPEGRRVFPKLSVLENLKMGGFLIHRKEKVLERVKEVFQYFPILDERKSQFAGTLSGGEQQMLALGRAFMANPSLMLMDEPSLGLAPLIVAEIAKIIRTFNQEGMTIILVEQNANMALRLAIRGYVIETGNIVLEGKAIDLRNNAHVKKAYLGG